jgi:3-dehydro-L-gulonate 2-dehydrogenase
LSFVLDVLAAMLTGGMATHDFSTDPAKEVGQSQVFLAIAPASVETIEELSRFAQGQSVAQKAIDALHAATPIQAEKPVRYPGEGALRVRVESMELGVVVEEAAWEAFVKLELELSHV